MWISGADGGATSVSPRRLRGLADIEEAAGLPPPKRGVMAVEPQELIVGALLDEVAAIEHHKPVHARDGREPLRDRDHGLAGYQ